MHEELDRGGRVFAHCEHGVGRGPLMVTAVLVAEGMSAPEALELVREQRWQTAPNDRQVEGLLAFEAYWSGAVGHRTRGNNGTT